MTNPSEEASERIRELESELAEANQQITAYQLTKDKLEMRVAHAVLADDKSRFEVFAGHWNY